MDLGLRGKKAIITGGTRGIGRAIAEALASEGCDIGLCARGEAAIAPTLEALRAKGVAATGAAVDVRDGAALREWIGAAAGELAAYVHDGFWQPMDTLREKNQLEALWDSGAAPWKMWA